jgi:sugar phosphate isomerase/epimerase
MIRQLLCFLLLASCLKASPFFAMDNGVPGGPAEVAATLHELGYDGLGGRGPGAKVQRAALEGKGIRLWNIYLTLKFAPGTPALTPEIRGFIEELKGHDATLWIAIQEVTGGDETAVASIREIAAHAASAGVKVSLYPHTGFWLARFADAVRVAGLVDRQDVGTTFNLCHWLKVEGDVDPIPLLKAEKAKLQFVTINGADKGDTKAMGWDRLIQPLDRGTYDVGALIRRLRDEVKWQGPVGLQGYAVPGDQRENLRRSMAAWRAMNGTLDGRVLCGYQGWFRAEGDGSNNGWKHYAVRGKFEPGHSHIEMWPDVSELAPDERFAAPFRHADGRVAEVFSSVKEPTIRRHFRWMKEHGIDGVFLQRFAAPARDPRFRGPMDQVMTHCRAAAAAEGRKWALMYDMSGLKPQDFGGVNEDRLRLKNEGPMKELGPEYLSYRGKPLIALWGLGFNDRPPALKEWEALVRQCRDDGLAVMLGVPCYWRTLDRDTIADPKLHEIIALADIVSPWAVGRFGTPQDAAARVDKLLKPDLAWCRERGVDYLPVIFPGFSWQNLQKSRGKEAKFDQIPRLGGKFLWSQAVAAKQAGAKALYVAMFDELDEGTAIFKTTQDPPVGASRFLSEPGVKSDHYLWLTGEIGRMVRGEAAGSGELPVRGSAE